MDRVWEDVHGAVLLAGGIDALADMLDIVADLPGDAHTTVILEVFAAAEIVDIPLPGDIRITWLVRSDAGRDTDARSRGSRLAAAVHAWCAEWACAQDDGIPPCTVWLASDTPSRVVRMTRALVPPTAF